jgi:hypothetical protein
MLYAHMLVLSAWYAIYFNSIFAAVFPVVTHRPVKGTGTKLAGYPTTARIRSVTVALLK